MRVIKKKGIKKVKIEHNRKLFWFIIGLIALLIFVIVMNSRGSRDEEFIGVVEDNLCAVDADCVKVDVDCCGCNMGGEEACVLKSE